MVETIGIDASCFASRTELLPQLLSLKTVHRTVFLTFVPKGSTRCLRQKKNRTAWSCFSLGGDDRDRTDYLLNAIQALSQVSYAPIGTSQPWLRL